MRLYFYISRAGSLSHLSRILIDAKSGNVENGITGIMSYNKGHYLQIVEGPEEEVGRLIKLIGNDERHSHVQSIMDVTTTHRYFGDSGMRLVPQLTRNREFQAFMIEMDSVLEQLSAHKHALTEIFHQYHHYSYPTNPKESSAWENQSYSVNQWPNFNKVNPTPELIALCSALFNNSLSYDDLIKGHYCTSERALKSQLEELINIECMTTSTLDADNRASNYGQHNYHTAEDMGFITKMKDFINNRTH